MLLPETYFFIHKAPLYQIDNLVLELRVYIIETKDGFEFLLQAFTK